MGFLADLCELNLAKLVQISPMSRVYEGIISMMGMKYIHITGGYHRVGQGHPCGMPVSIANVDCESVNI